MELKEWEKRVLLKFTDQLSDIMGNAGCNDTDQDIIDLIPGDELSNIDKKYNDYNGSPEDHNPENPRTHLLYFCLLGYIEGRIKGEIK